VPLPRLVLEVALDALAVRRATKLVVEDEVTEDLRELVWKHFPPEENKLGYLFTCHACTSVWAAAVVRSGVLPRWSRDILALSELSLLLKSLVDDKSGF
jgi:hypothetical protein